MVGELDKWMESQINGWRVRLMDGELDKWMESQINGWRVR